MRFDRAKCEDEYMKMEQIDLDDRPEPVKALYGAAADCREDAEAVYTALTRTAYVELPPLVDAAMRHADPSAFRELREEMEAAGDERQKAEYQEAIDELTKAFQREGGKLNGTLAAMGKSMADISRELERNCRRDLTSGIYLYGRVEDAMRTRGEQVAELASVIKDVYIARMDALKEKIKKYDGEIDRFLDPQNTFESFLKAMPSADEFASIAKFADGKGDAEVEAMKAAYSVALKGVALIGARIVNVEKMEERDRLQEELDRLQKEYDKYKELYDKTIREYGRVKGLVALLDGMRFFAGQAGGFAEEAAAHQAGLEAALGNGDVPGYRSALQKAEEALSVFWR